MKFKTHPEGWFYGTHRIGGEIVYTEQHDGDSFIVNIDDVTVGRIVPDAEGRAMWEPNFFTRDVPARGRDSVDELMEEIVPLAAAAIRSI